MGYVGRQVPCAELSTGGPFIHRFAENDRSALRRGPPPRTLCGMNDVLALIADPNLMANLRRVAAASDRDLDESVSPPPRRNWSDAGVVVVDHESALACASNLPRRAGVVLVCSGTPDLREWQAAATVGAEHVLGLPEDEVELLGVLGAAAEPETHGGSVVAVVGGCGGAGASTFAAALARAAVARDGAGVLLVDGDPFGGGLDVLTGLEERPGVRWSGLSVDGGRLSARALRDAVPTWAPGLGVLSTDRDTGELGAAAITAVLDATRRSGATVVCDVPRSFDVAAEAMIASADLTVVVVPARVGAALSAARAGRWIGERTTRCGIVVRGPAPGGLRAADVADVVGLPLVTAMRPHPGLAEILERGGLRLGRRSPLLAAAAEVLDDVDARRSGARRAA